MLKKISIAILTLLLPIISKAQSLPAMDAFAKFVTRTYRLPEELKSNCEWMYAIVKVKTDSRNKITRYDFINTPSEAMKKSFSFLKGYQFPKAMRINGHPIVFYMAIDNLEGCTEKPGDKMFYAPNEAASVMWGLMNQLLINDPKTIFVPSVLISGYGKPRP